VSFYEKVIKVKADVAALLMFDFRHISTEKFALGSLRSDDWQLGRPIASPLFVCLPVSCEAVKGAAEWRRSS
jgi:hypothetical protein